MVNKNTLDIEIVAWPSIAMTKRSDMREWPITRLHNNNALQMKR